MTTAFVLAAGANDPGLVEACGPKGQQSWLCSVTYKVTGSATAADVADALAKPLRILLILVIAFFLVRIGRTLVNRFVAQMSTGVERLATVGAGISFVDTHPMSPARRNQRAQTVGAVLRSLVAILVWSIALVTVLDELGVNLAPLLAGAGIVGIALGFGAQSLVKDFVSGLFMLLEDQYSVGDVVDTGVAVGTVEGVSLRTTRLRDANGVVWHVPNGVITRLGNRSQQWARALVDVPIAYESDLTAATSAIKSVTDDLWHDAAFESAITGEPEVLGVEELAPGRMVVRVSMRTLPQQQARVQREFRARIKAALDAAGIAAPAA